MIRTYDSNPAGTINLTPLPLIIASAAQCAWVVSGAGCSPSYDTSGTPTCWHQPASTPTPVPRVPRPAGVVRTTGDRGHRPSQAGRGIFGRPRETQRLTAEP